MIATDTASPSIIRLEVTSALQVKQEGIVIAELFAGLGDTLSFTAPAGSTLLLDGIEATSVVVDTSWDIQIGLKGTTESSQLKVKVRTEAEPKEENFMPPGWKRRPAAEQQAARRLR